MLQAKTGRSMGNRSPKAPLRRSGEVLAEHWPQGGDTGGSGSFRRFGKPRTIVRYPAALNREPAQSACRLLKLVILGGTFRDQRRWRSILRSGLFFGRVGRKEWSTPDCLKSKLQLLRKPEGRPRVIAAAGEPARFGTASSEAGMNQVGELA
jgi:hypothetical protein